MKAIDILNQHNLKRTSCREGLLDVLIEAQRPISENQIRALLPGNYDRTTFYRSFKTLEENNIIHKIVVDSQFVTYALANEITHRHNHAHFYCHECHKVQCLDEVPVMSTPLPEGYEALEKEVIIKGICPECHA